MRLKAVTFTGIDDRTNLRAVEELSREFPFVEWGILLSVSKTGCDNRYPDLGTLYKISKMDVNKSVHLCGTLARDAAGGELRPFEYATRMMGSVNRVQVNLGNALDSHKSAYRNFERASQMFHIFVIMQCPSFFTPTVQKAAPGAYASGVQFFHDASGGRGISGEFDTPPNTDFVGFAGGITPENVVQKLEQIAALNCPNPYWIDIETGVRTGDYLDLGKVESILRAVKPFVQETDTE